jgi:hypothetical protein
MTTLTDTDTTIEPEVTDPADLDPNLTDTASVPSIETDHQATTANNNDTAEAEQEAAALPAPTAADSADRGPSPAHSDA